MTPETYAAVAALIRTAIADPYERDSALAAIASGISSPPGERNKGLNATHLRTLENHFQIEDFAILYFRLKDPARALSAYRYYFLRLGTPIVHEILLTLLLEIEAGNVPENPAAVFMARLQERLRFKTAQKEAAKDGKAPVAG